MDDQRLTEMRLSNRTLNNTDRVDDRRTCRVCCINRAKHLCSDSNVAAVVTDDDEPDIAAIVEHSCDETSSLWLMADVR